MPDPLSDDTPSLYTIRVFDYFSRTQTHILSRLPDSESPALNFILHGFLVKMPTLSEVALSLQTL